MILSDGKSDTMSVGDEMLARYGHISDSLDALADKIGCKLSKVCYDIGPVPDNSDADVKKYPEYFDNFRKFLLNIDNRLGCINMILDKCEIAKRSLSIRAEEKQDQSIDSVLNDSVFNIIIQLANTESKLAVDTATRLEIQLASIMRIDKKSGEDVGMKEIEMPVAFNELRGYVIDLESSIRKMNECMDLVEL